MYYPYFRGKQYDLLAIKECANTIANAKFKPIIEPVRESLNSLTRCLTALDQVNAESILIVNPRHGDHRQNWNAIQTYYQEEIAGFARTYPGILLLEDDSLNDIKEIIREFEGGNLFLIHSGFSEARSLSTWLQSEQVSATHIFIDNHCLKTYRRHFDGPNRVLIRDGFERRVNSKHPDLEMFSDLHVTYRSDEGMTGFGDFLTVGDDYSESGGPAYAVAIHITFIDSEDENVMYVYHFKSDTQDSPKNPGMKLQEAVAKLAEKFRSPNSQIVETTAIREFMALHQEEHFPGLGYIKKLSMVHHIETMADFFS